MKTRRLLSLTLALCMLCPLLFSCKGEEQKNKYTAHSLDYFDTAATITGYETTKEKFDEVSAEILAELGEYTPPSLTEYAEAAAKILAITSPDTVIHRLTGDCPRDMLLAPEWNSDKHAVIEKIKEYMEENRLFQGKYYKKPPR